MKSFNAYEKKVNRAEREIDVCQLLREQGVPYSKVSEKWVKLSCLLPEHSDNRPSFYIDVKSLGYNCYGCGNSGYLPDLFSLLGWNVRPIHNNLIRTVNSDMWNFFLDGVSSLGKKRVKEIKLAKPAGIEDITPCNMLCARHYDYLKSRGLHDCINIFRFKYTILRDFENYGNNYLKSIIFPVHDMHGKTIWYESRKIHSNVDRKYYRPYGIRKGETLFNYHRVIKKRYKYVIVVEGVIDCMHVHKWDYSCVSIFGTAISDFQLEQLSLFSRIYLCYDNDPAGIAGYKKAKKYLVGAGSEVFRILLPKGRDIDEIGKAEFERRFFSARKVY
jgi:hypothetical protein